MMQHNYKGKVAIITGGGGALGGAMAMSLAQQGVKVVVLDRTESTAMAKADEIIEMDGEAIGLVSDVLEKEQLQATRSKIVEKWGRIDILINAAGGNMKGATIMPEDSFFDMDMGDFDAVTKLNLNGTVLPTMVFGEQMAKQKKGRHNRP